MAQNYKLYRIIYTGRLLFMQDLNTLTISNLFSTLQSARHISIIPHKNPDGDAIGCSLGLWHYLSSKGIKATVMVNDAVPEFLKFLEGTSEIRVFESEPDQCQKIIDDSDFIFCVDYAQLHRSGGLEPLIRSSSAKKIVVDHHPGPEDSFDFSYHDVSSSSTCELIYYLIREIDPEYRFSLPAANALYTGLVTDTGCFKHALRPQTFMAAAELLKSGISYEFLVSNIFDVNTPERLKLIGFALNEKMQILKEYRTAIFSLSMDEYENIGVKKGDTEGLVNYALSIQNMVMGVFFHEREKGKTKISFRSKGNFAVNELSAQYFNGGGHKNAAGGEFNGPVGEAVKHFMEILPQYKEQLTSLEIGKRD